MPPLLTREGAEVACVLDAPTTELDPQARRDTWSRVEQVRARGITVVLTTQCMDEAKRLCDRVVVLDRGAVAALGTPAELTALTASAQQVRFALPARSPMTSWVRSSA